MREHLQNINIQQLKGFSTETLPVDLLRLDLFHPVVSGNKWFKLQFYLEEAVRSGKTSIATFGGAYSNHIVATACAAAEMGLESIGFIRGENNGVSNPSLMEAQAYGMELVFVERESYRNKQKIQQQWDKAGRYWIMEGGYGIQGALGAAEILTIFDTRSYSHIICAVGTGTMMAGLIKNAGTGQQVIGISVLKNHYGLEKEVRALLTETEKDKDFIINHTYHFGGYAKQTPALFNFMKDTWVNEGVPTDIIYTSKLLYASRDLLKKNYFPAGSMLLIVHSGGLQGNRSVPTGRLPF